jgi:hypothetical protein
MMNEMRKAHLQEVKLLQRGLEARGNDEKFRNRVNETADLVDKLGRSVVQRDEAIRDKAKAQGQMNKMIVDLRALADECSKLRRQNKNLDVRLKEAIRKGKAVAPPIVDRDNAEFEESDEEFEVELLHFEKRFRILEEGPMGLDILASNLARDKRLLEKALQQQQEAHKATLASLEEWKALNEEKDNTITEQNQKIEDMMMAQAALEEEIERKRREVEEAVNKERDALEQRLAELQAERDEARNQADSMVLASDKLSQELVKVHEQYDDATKRKQAEKADMAMLDEPEAEDTSGWEMIKERDDHKVKTNEQEPPCAMKLSVWQQEDGEKFQLRAEVDGNVTRISITDTMLEELDPNPDNRWVELFSRVGLSSDDPPGVVVSELLGEQEATFPPSESAVLCRIHRFDVFRYYVSGTSLVSSFMSDYVIIKGDLESDPDICSAINSGADKSELLPLLLGKLSFKEDEGFYWGTD